MFWNIFSKRILFSIRSKDTLIWTWIFPIMLSTLFFATLSSVDAAGQLREIPLAVVDDGAYRLDPSLSAMLESLSGETGNRLFALTPVPDVAEADSLLYRGEVDAYILVDSDRAEPSLVVGADGLNQTIARSVLESYIQTRGAARVALENGSLAGSDMAALLERAEFTQEISLSRNPPSGKLNYYYALLAMVCMYGAFQGLTTVSVLQANLSPLGARRTMSPVGRFRMVLYDLLGGVTVHLVCLLLTVAYIIVILRIEFGSTLWGVLLACFAGSLLGVAFGAMVSVTSKLKEQAKVAILICATMVCCFLSGLMMDGISYDIMQKAPVVSWLNPAARITDAFYCLYYYDNYERFLLNIGIVLAMAAAMFAVTAFFVRRQRYESI